MTVYDTLNSLIEPVCNELGYDVVRIQLTGGERRKLLQIMIERHDLKNLTVDDCEKVSRALSPILDEKDPIESNYSLEVSSPGIDRPLIKLADFDRFKGFEAKIETTLPVNGRKRFVGRLAGTEQDNVLINFEGAVLTINHGQIAKSKLVLTDELIEKTLNEEGNENGK